MLYAASPIVEDDGLGRAFLEMHGIARDPAGWLSAVRVRHSTAVPNRNKIPSAAVRRQLQSEKPPLSALERPLSKMNHHAARQEADRRDDDQRE